MLKKLINKIIFSIYGEDVLITNEGWSYLNDPEKRKKLREWIEIYHKTGKWDYSFWGGEKTEYICENVWCLKGKVYINGEQNFCENCLNNEKKLK